MRLSALLLVSSLLALSACESAPPDDAWEEEQWADPTGKVDDGTTLPTFREVDPAHSSEPFRRYVGRALVVLRDHADPIARATYRSIVEGKVLVDALSDLTCSDFKRVQKDFEGSWAIPDAAFGRLQEPRSYYARRLAEDMDGYMWGNRVYVSRGQSPESLASSLVHEVNHVLNRSDHGYYEDLPTSGFLHEYRAFYVEARVFPELYEGIDLVDHVIESYELERAGIREGALRDPLTPRILPDADAWRARDLESDVPDDDEACLAALED